MILVVVLLLVGISLSATSQFRPLVSVLAGSSHARRCQTVVLLVLLLLVLVLLVLLLVVVVLLLLLVVVRLLVAALLLGARTPRECSASG